MVALTAEEILAFYPHVTEWLPGFTPARLQLHTTFHHALPRRSMVPGNLGALFFGECFSWGYGCCVGGCESMCLWQRVLPAVWWIIYRRSAVELDSDGRYDEL